MARAAGPLGAPGSSATREPYLIAAPPAKDIEISRRRKTISLSFDIDSATVVLFSSESMLPVPFWLFSDARIALYALLGADLAALLRQTMCWLECNVDLSC